MSPAVSEDGVESGAMDGGAWNPESCPRYTKALGELQVLFLFNA